MIVFKIEGIDGAGGPEVRHKMLVRDILRWPRLLEIDDYRIR